MKKAMFAFAVTIVVGALVLAQQMPPAGGSGKGNGPGGQGRGAGRGPNAPAIPNLSLRPTGSSLGMIRVGASDEKISRLSLIYEVVNDEIEQQIEVAAPGARD